MLDLHQKIKNLIQWLSFRFVSLIFTPMDKRLKTGSFQTQKKINDKHQLSVLPGLECDKKIRVFIHKVEQACRAQRKETMKMNI
jgi:hypothetical protein